MRYYDLTATKEGEPYPFAMENVSEWSLKTLRPVFAKDGVELHATHRFSVPDKPLYRRATDEERAAGSPRLVENDIAANDY